MAKPAKRGYEIERILERHINNISEIGKGIIKFVKDTLNINCKNIHAERPSKGRPKVDLIVKCDGEEILFSIKSFNPKADYNHVERDFVEKYKRDWNISEDVYKALKIFVGEVDNKGNPIPHKEFLSEVEKLSNDEIKQEIKNKIKDPQEQNDILKEIYDKGKGISPGLVGKIRRRTFLQMSQENPDLVKKVIEFFKSNKDKIIKSIFINNEPIDKFFFIIAEIIDDKKVCYYITTAKSVIDVYAKGDVIITKEGNLLIGKVEMQRKGGDHWNKKKTKWHDESANQLQFKIRPTEIIKSVGAEKVGCENIEEKSEYGLDEWLFQ